MTIQTLVLCNEFMYACIIAVCCLSTEPVFDHILHFFITMHACAAPSTASGVWTCENHLEPGLDCRQDKKKMSQAKSEFRNQNTVHTSESAAFSIFLLILNTTNSKIRKDYCGPLTLKWCNLSTCAKCYKQIIFTFWMTLLLHKPVLVLYELSFSQWWLQRRLKTEATHSSKMLTDFIRPHGVLSQKTTLQA